MIAYPPAQRPRIVQNMNYGTNRNEPLRLSLDTDPADHIAESPQLGIPNPGSRCQCSDGRGAREGDGPQSLIIEDQVSGNTKPLCLRISPGSKLLFKRQRFRRQTGNGPGVRCVDSLTGLDSLRLRSVLLLPFHHERDRSILRPLSTRLAEGNLPIGNRSLVCGKRCVFKIDQTCPRHTPEQTLEMASRNVSLWVDLAV